MGRWRDPTTSPRPERRLAVADPLNNSNFQGFANLVAQVLLADATGSTPTIPNPLATSQLDTAILTNPAQIKAYRESVADQMNAGSAGPKIADLSDRIADLILDTRVQGAGTLEVHLIDPMWLIPMSGFIQADIEGRLWPAIDIHFPADTECVWRLCQFSANWGAGSDQANLVLTFEDRIWSLLRSISPGNGGLEQGQPNQTLGGFIKMLVDNANQNLHAKIRLLELIDPQDPNYTPQITQTNTPTHLASKLNKGLTGQMKQLLDNLDAHLLGAFPSPGGTMTMTATEQLVAGKMAQLAGLVGQDVTNPLSALGLQDPIYAPQP
jgi:hypothetical protein